MTDQTCVRAGLWEVGSPYISQIADMVLSFKVRTIGTDFETSMIVSKFRNSPENLKILVFRVTPDEAITPETVERIA